jgi:hypothetical protein
MLENRMIIIRSDTVGSIDMRLVSRPTNTCVGIDNYWLIAKGAIGPFPAPLMRFVGTDEGWAHSRYNAAVDAACACYGLSSS